MGCVLFGGTQNALRNWRGGNPGNPIAILRVSFSGGKHRGVSTFLSRTSKPVPTQKKTPNRLQLQVLKFDVEVVQPSNDPPDDVQQIAEGSEYLEPICSTPDASGLVRGWHHTQLPAKMGVWSRGSRSCMGHLGGDVGAHKLFFLGSSV